MPDQREAEATDPDAITETGETVKERIDRELGEMLQGLRVAQPGVQVLFAFLLTVPFAAGFGTVTMAQRWIFYVALTAAAVAAACFVAPAAQHRLMFRAGLKEELLHRANVYAVIGAAALAVSMTAATLLVVEVLVGGLAAGLTAGAIGALFGWLWFLQPMIERARGEGSA